MLQQDHSVSLLRRLIHLKPGANFLAKPFRRTILSQPKLPNTSFGDPLLLLAVLQRGNEDGEHEAQAHVWVALMLKASKSREQTDRAFFATSAAFYATASGSLSEIL